MTHPSPPPPPASRRTRTYATALGALAVAVCVGVFLLLKGPRPEVGESGREVSSPTTPTPTGAATSDPTLGGPTETGASGGPTRSSAREATGVPAGGEEGVYGYVLDLRGGGVADAQITLTDADAEGAALATARSARDGAYVVGPAPERPLRVRAQAQGYAPSGAVVAMRGSRVDLVLDAGGSLRVLVVAPTGAPLAGVRVTQTTGAVRTELLTDARGRATFDSLPVGLGNVVAWKEGFAPFAKSFVPVLPGRFGDVGVVLLPAVVLAGRVVAEAGGAAVAGATISVENSTLPSIPHSGPVTSDREGRFRVQVFAGAGQLAEVVVQADGFSPVRARLPAIDPQRGALEAVIPLTTADAVIEGRVEDSGGHAVSGVLVTLAAGTRGVGTPEARTDAAGRFSLASPPTADPADGWPLLAMAADGSIGLARGHRAVRGGAASATVIRLAGAGSVIGRVVDADGVPLAGAALRLDVTPTAKGAGADEAMLAAVLQETRPVKFEALSGRDGRYAFPAVPVSLFRLTASRGVIGATHPETVAVHAGEVVVVDLTLRPGNTIEGVVRDDTGRAVAGAPVGAALRTPAGAMGRWVEVPSRSDGTFVLPGLEEGTWQVSANALHYVGTEPIDVRVGTRDLVLTVRSMASLRLVVLDENSPYRGTVTVRVKPATAGAVAGTRFQTAIDSEDGSFEIDGLEPGEHLVSVSALDGRTSGDDVRVELRARERAHELTLRLKKYDRPATGSLRVTVTDAAGRGLAGAEPVVFAANGTEVRRSRDAMQAAGLIDASLEAWERALRTDEHGVNVWRQLPPGRYRVSAALEGKELEGEATWVDVAPSAEVGVTLILKDRATPTGSGK